MNIDNGAYSAKERANTSIARIHVYESTEKNAEKTVLTAQFIVAHFVLILNKLAFLPGRTQKEPHKEKEFRTF